MFAQERLLCTNTKELFLFKAEQIVYIEAQGNYSHIYTSGGTKHLLTVQIGQIARMIELQMPLMARRFIRIGRNYIVNESYIFKIEVPKSLLILYDRTDQRYNLTPSAEALKALKSHLEDMYGKNE